MNFLELHCLITMQLLTRTYTFFNEMESEMGNTVLKPEDYKDLKAKLFNKYETTSRTMSPNEEKKRKEFLNAVNLFEKKIASEIPECQEIEPVESKVETIQPCLEEVRDVKVEIATETPQEETLDEKFDRIISENEGVDLIQIAVDEMKAVEETKTEIIEENEQNMDPELADQTVDPEMEMETQEIEQKDEDDILQQMLGDIENLLRKLIPKRKVEFEQYYQNMIRSRYKHKLISEAFNQIFTKNIVEDKDLMDDLNNVFCELSTLKNGLRDMIDNNDETVRSSRISQYEKLLEIVTLIRS